MATKVNNELRATSLRDLELFAEVVKAKSIREIARRRHMEPGQISRTLQRLEKRLGVTLLSRSLKGVVLTSQGQEALRSVELILNEMQNLDSLELHKATELKNRVYTFGSSSYLTSKIIAPATGQVLKERPEFRCRLVDFAPESIVAQGLRGAFDLALHIENLDWPKSWISEKVGEISWALFARAGHPLLRKKPIIDAIRATEFVIPVYWTTEGFGEGQDNCPLPIRKRMKGFGTSTAEAALEIVATTDHIAFLPQVLAREKIKLGLITRVNVPEWKPVKKDVYLSARTDLVPNSLYRLMHKIFAELLNVGTRH